MLSGMAGLLSPPMPFKQLRCIILIDDKNRDRTDMLILLATRTPRRTTKAIDLTDHRPHYLLMAGSASEMHEMTQNGDLSWLKKTQDDILQATRGTPLHTNENFTYWVMATS